MDNYKKIHETADELATYLNRYSSLEELNQDYVINERFNFDSLLADAEISAKLLDKSSLDKIISLALDKSGFYELL